MKKTVKSAKLELTALGTYVVRLNGEKLGRGVLAPGWTSCSKRL
ncbi:MAG: alpha-L-rhamnosidase N-terminal domain-containing protein [Faecousia sp.]